MVKCWDGRLRGQWEGHGLGIRLVSDSLDTNPLTQGQHLSILIPQDQLGRDVFLCLEVEKQKQVKWLTIWAIGTHIMGLNFNSSSLLAKFVIK